MKGGNRAAEPLDSRPENSTRRGLRGNDARAADDL